jgi:hypothetical protein
VYYDIYGSIGTTGFGSEEECKGVECEGDVEL